MDGAATEFSLTGGHRLYLRIAQAAAVHSLPFRPGIQEGAARWQLTSCDPPPHKAAGTTPRLAAR